MIRGGPREAHAVEPDGHEVREPLRRDRAGLGPADGRTTLHGRRAEQLGRGVASTHPGFEALVELDRPSLLEHVDQRMGVGAERKARSGLRQAPRPPHAIGEVTLRGRTETDSAPPAAEQVDVGSVQMGGVNGGEVPRDRAALEALPGVGRKTANVVMNTAFGEATIAVDTHIFRVCNRTGLAPGKDVRAVEDKLMKVVPEDYKRDAHHWLILHGRYVCKARKPDCPNCVIRDLCRFKDKTPGEAG